MASRLLQIKRFQAAADLYSRLNNTKVRTCYRVTLVLTMISQGVIESYCMGGLFEEAKKACGSNATLLQYVKDRYQGQLIQAEDVDALIAQGYTIQVSALQSIRFGGNMLGRQ